jgi:hypothetical protein
LPLKSGTVFPPASAARIVTVTGEPAVTGDAIGSTTK